MITHPQGPGANFLAPASGIRKISRKVEEHPTTINQNFIFNANFLIYLVTLGIAI